MCFFKFIFDLEALRNPPETLRLCTKPLSPSGISCGQKVYWLYSVKSESIIDNMMSMFSTQSNLIFLHFSKHCGKFVIIKSIFDNI